ncbi:hypothetical protein LNP74_19795 [Klebsiella pneumoniae subsp. pneumoniae]|nr:hypothetical protein [Klebsiella pneumoniae subsp. pneumoniae]
MSWHVYLHVSYEISHLPASLAQAIVGTLSIIYTQKVIAMIRGKRIWIYRRKSTVSLFCIMGETGESTLWLCIVVNCGSSPGWEINRQEAIMYYSNVVISYLQANEILAMKLDRAVSGIEQRVSGQVKTIGAGVTRILYYTSCFTDEYQDVCKKAEE